MKTTLSLVSFPSVWCLLLTWSFRTVFVALENAVLSHFLLSCVFVIQIEIGVVLYSDLISCSRLSSLSVLSSCSLFCDIK